MATTLQGCTTILAGILQQTKGKIRISTAQKDRAFPLRLPLNL